jgi:UDP-N-acetyl-2-amino-2-deoxyglucuronate dehydrogenase
MSLSRIRIALLGCGRISRKHFDAFESNATDVELVAVCDIDRAALDAAVTRTKARGFESLEQLIGWGEFELLVIATPSGLHARQAIRAADAGFDVITEKPMATRWSDGKEMVARFDQAERSLFVVKQNRFNAPVQRVKKAISAGRFGRIYMITANVFWCRPQSYYDSAPWRGTWEFDGGAFMNQASHYVDLMDWLGGPVESVQAFTATLARAIEVEDTGTVSIKWRSGSLGSLNVTTLACPRDLEGSITIIGEKGTAKIGGVALNEMLQWEFLDSCEDDSAALASGYATTSVYGFSHSIFYQNVIKALRSEEKALVSGREGLRSLELLAAIYQSARDGRRVSLPLEH